MLFTDIAAAFPSADRLFLFQPKGFNLSALDEAQLDEHIRAMLRQAYSNTRITVQSVYSIIATGK